MAPIADERFELPCGGHGAALTENHWFGLVEILSQFLSKLETLMSRRLGADNVAELWKQEAGNSAVFKTPRGLRWGMRFWNVNIVISRKQQLKTFLEKTKTKSAKELVEFWNKNDINNELMQTAFMTKLSSDIWKRLVTKQSR